MINKQIQLEIANNYPPVVKHGSINLAPNFPTTRFQGSKRKVLPEIASLLSSLTYSNPLDMFSGSGIVSLLFRFLGKKVNSNDFMLFNQNTAALFQTFNFERLSEIDYKKELLYLLYQAPISNDPLVSNLYKGIFFTNDENKEIDRFCQNIHLHDEFSVLLYTYAVGQALLKKRPYNLFHRANLGIREANVSRSFGNKKTWDTSIFDHAIKCITELLEFSQHLPNRQKSSVSGNNSAQLDKFRNDFDLIYLDPPYINDQGKVIDYSDFYSFLEGLCDYSLFLKGNTSYPHKPIQKKESAWAKAESSLEELMNISLKWPKAVIILSYRSDGQLSPDDLRSCLENSGRNVQIHRLKQYQYVLSKKCNSDEILIIGS